MLMEAGFNSGFCKRYDWRTSDRRPGKLRRSLRHRKDGLLERKMIVKANVLEAEASFS